MPPTIAGAWELISATEHGILVATDTHVSVLIMARDRAVIRDGPRTDADDAAAYRSFLAQAGRYAIDGAHLIHHRTYTRDPASSGTDEVFAFRVTGDTLIVQSVHADDTHGEVFTWQKVG
jgi:hypothetical protein